MKAVAKLYRFAGAFAGQICDHAFVQMKSAIRMLEILSFEMNDSGLMRRMACTTFRSMMIQ